MAYGAVSFAIETVSNILVKEGNLLYGVKGRVEEMKRELECMHEFLEDAEMSKEADTRVRICVSEIQNAAYDVEDVIEHFVLKSALRNWNRNQKGLIDRINHSLELHQVGSRIEDIKAKLSKLRTRLQTYGIIGIKVDGEEVQVPVIRRRKRQDHAHAHVIDHNVVGLDEKIIELVQDLIDSKEASLVCVYGMGGIGKTTAAKKVYNDSKIRTHFERFAWVFISQKFIKRKVWESILIQISNKREEETRKLNEDELTSQLCSIQKERRCLITIDDVWSSQDWDSLSVAFPSLVEGSRSKILLTSRNQMVASLATHRVLYSTSLDILDHSNSLKLLKNTILVLGGPNHPLIENSIMEKAAGEMVEQCEGLPLAIVVLGGILATKHEVKEWKRVVLALKRCDGGVASVLESSYQDLPYYLKSCFLFLSQYPKDEHIKATELIQRWIGEGFVASSTENEDETKEDVAEGYLNELVSRCMIQVGEKGHTGRVKTCSVHALIRDLCISKAEEDGFARKIDLKVENAATILEKVSSTSSHRLCILSGGSKYNLGTSMLSSLRKISPQLRSIWFNDFDEDQGKAAMVIVKRLKVLRVLELPITITCWYIENLLHLRLLKLHVRKLPTTIGNLRYLETLKLENCEANLIIPDSVWGMEQLRHLYLPLDGGVCESSKQRASDLRNLQTLVNFPPKKFDMEQNLIKLTSVRKLVINSNWEEKDRISRTRRSQETVFIFNRLESLCFDSYNEHVDLEDITRSCPSLYRLVVNRPVRFPETASCISSIWPSNLTKLVLQHTKLDESHMGPLGMLQSLRTLLLEFNAFIGKKMIFSVNDFPQLYHLKLVSLSELEEWRANEGALPNLLCLEIQYCSKLKSLAHGSQFLKQLKELKVKYMPYRFRMSLKQEWDRFSHIPSVYLSNIYPGESSNKVDHTRGSKEEKLEIIEDKKEAQTVELLTSQPLVIGGIEDEDHRRQVSEDYSVPREELEAEMEKRRKIEEELVRTKFELKNELEMEREARKAADNLSRAAMEAMRKEMEKMLEMMKRFQDSGS